MPFNPLDHPVSLLEPIMVTQNSAWVEHLPLAYALIDMVRPERAVELGVHFGDSYCAFCQAVAHLRLPTQLFGIDTWRGDDHAGSYGPEILQLLRAHHDPRYGSFSKLIQIDFDTAREQFEDGSVDLLHIDGFHTYEAVKHDYETWLPKMSARGVVLFHDTASREADFGVYKLWAELAGKHPNFEFLHGPGLGILAIGPQIPPRLKPLLEATPPEAQCIRDFYARLGREIGMRRFYTLVMRTIFQTQSLINQWKQTTGQSVVSESHDIRFAMNNSYSFAVNLRQDVETLVNAELKRAGLKSGIR